jgi:hypothetical protein
MGKTGRMKKGGPTFLLLPILHIFTILPYSPHSFPQKLKQPTKWLVS